MATDGRITATLLLSAALTVTHVSSGGCSDNDDVAAAAAADVGYNNPDTVAADFLKAHPTADTCSCSEALRFEQDVIALGNTVGKRARVDFFAKLTVLKRRWIATLRAHVGVDRDVAQVLDDVLLPELQKLWATVVAVNTLLRKQFIQLHTRGAELLVRSGAVSVDIVQRLIGVYAQLPADIDQVSDRNEAEYHRIEKHFKRVVAELEATVREQWLSVEVLQYGVEALWRLLVAEEEDLLTEFSAGALEVHRVADARAVAEVLSQASCARVAQ